MLYSYYLQSLQRLSTRVCKYFPRESANTFAPIIADNSDNSSFLRWHWKINLNSSFTLLRHWIIHLIYHWIKSLNFLIVLLVATKQLIQFSMIWSLNIFSIIILICQTRCFVYSTKTELGIYSGHSWSVRRINSLCIVSSILAH